MFRYTALGLLSVVVAGYWGSTPAYAQALGNADAPQEVRRLTAEIRRLRSELQSLEERVREISPPSAPARRPQQQGPGDQAGPGERPQRGPRGGFAGPGGGRGAGGAAGGGGGGVGGGVAQGAGGGGGVGPGGPNAGGPRPDLRRLRLDLQALEERLNRLTEQDSGNQSGSGEPRQRGFRRGFGGPGAAWAAGGGFGRGGFGGGLGAGVAQGVGGGGLAGPAGPQNLPPRVAAAVMRPGPGQRGMASGLGSSFSPGVGLTVEWDMENKAKVQTRIGTVDVDWHSEGRAKVGFGR